MFIVSCSQAIKDRLTQSKKALVAKNPGWLEFIEDHFNRAFLQFRGTYCMGVHNFIQSPLELALILQPLVLGKYFYQETEQNFVEVINVPELEADAFLTLAFGFSFTDKA